MQDLEMYCRFCLISLMMGYEISIIGCVGNMMFIQHIPIQDMMMMVDIDVL